MKDQDKVLNEQETNQTEDTEKEIHEVETNVIDYKDKYVRLLAEFSNFQRQKDAELKSMAKFGNSNMLLKVIDILDDLETALIQPSVSEESRGLLDMVKAKMQHLITMEGVLEIELKKGDAYDATKCEVITAIDDNENSGKIIEIVRKGYTISDRILRTAKVVVGK